MVCWRKFRFNSQELCVTNSYDSDKSWLKNKLFSRIFKRKNTLLYLVICNKKSNIENLKMLFWLLKDAQLTCKRCPFGVLLTPFWSPIKHLYKSSFVTHCSLVSYKIRLKAYVLIKFWAFSSWICHNISISLGCCFITYLDVIFILLGIFWNKIILCF